MDGLKRNLNIEGNISEFKGRSIVTILIEPQKLNWKERVCLSVRCTHTVQYTCNEVPKGEAGERMDQKQYKKHMTEKFPIMTEDINSPIQEAQQSPNIKNTTIPRHTLEIVEKQRTMIKC